MDYQKFGFDSIDYDSFSSLLKHVHVRFPQPNSSVDQQYLTRYPSTNAGCYCSFMCPYILHCLDEYSHIWSPQQRLLRIRWPYVQSWFREISGDRCCKNSRSNLRLGISEHKLSNHFGKYWTLHSALCSISFDLLLSFGSAWKMEARELENQVLC